MRQYDLKFEGYTWDEYFYVIANKAGVLVAYKGGLDSEGAVKLDNIIYVGEADELNILYESHAFKTIRKQTGSQYRLFFSYAEMPKGNRAEVTQALKNAIFRENSNNNNTNVNLICEGACALFPQELFKAK